MAKLNRIRVVLAERDLNNKGYLTNWAKTLQLFPSG